ncbi:hypothetical protein [Chitinibacter sp. GC72]|uniref:hypothetical protein n=1 Tax=Chitinibacter sp. GC72 TaxID=1526917 RepID=UPI0012F7E53B|nr:hypothetical protein [Chitinibacter sp. GC72]
MKHFGSERENQTASTSTVLNNTSKNRAQWAEIATPNAQTVQTLSRTALSPLARAEF